jgi:hypothetical protein
MVWYRANVDLSVTKLLTSTQNSPLGAARLTTRAADSPVPREALCLRNQKAVGMPRMAE